MPRVFANGGIIGKTLDFDSTLPYGTAYVGGASGTQSGNNAITVTFTSLTGGVGGGVLPNDLVVAVVGAGDDTDRTLTLATAGYTKLYDLYQNDADDSGLGVFYKVMGATPDTNVVTGTNTSGTGSQALIVQVWRGVNTSTPIGANASAGAINGSLANPPAITTTSPNSRVIAIGTAGHSAGTVVYTQGGDLENFITVGANNSDDVTLGVGSIIGVISASGTVVDPIAFSMTTNTNYSNNAVTLELIAKNPYSLTLQNSGIWEIGYRYVANTG